MKYDVCIVGGGASGMMAAILAAQAGAKVQLIDKNSRLGEKLRITGGGRCNILNAEYDVRALLAHFGESDKFLYSSFSRFGVQETIDFFSELGIEIKVEAKNRAFPVSESAGDVVNAMTSKLKELGVDIQLNTVIGRVICEDGEIKSIQSKSDEFTAQSYIFASGGTSRPETGATGDGFEWLKELGHSVSDPTPDITPLAIVNPYVELAGLRIENTKVDFYLNRDKSVTASGDILFTHFGLSGPAILNTSSKVNELLQSGEQIIARIDCLPGFSDEELHQELIQTFAAHPAKQIKQALKLVLPSSLVATLVNNVDYIDFTKKTSETSKDTRTIIVNIVKSMEYEVSGLMGEDKAVVADGGIDLVDIDTKTMRSNQVKNLYVTGDLLNINRPTGGYSLQLAWTTGAIAGTSAAQA